MRLVGSVGNHGLFPVWDGATGTAPSDAPALFVDDPAYHEYGLCHVALSGDGTRMYTTSVDAKGLRAWDTCRAGTGRSGGGRCVWRSERLAIRGVYLAGLAILPRPRHSKGSYADESGERGGYSGGRGGGPQRHPRSETGSGTSATEHSYSRGTSAPPPLLATCAASLVPGTCYAEPDARLRIVLVDAADGSEVRRYDLEGIGACNRFVDCSTLTAGGGGTLLFLAHKDGSVWVHGASNGAQVAVLHGHSTWGSTSGHHRLLPVCVATGGDGEFLYSATTDGQCVHRWQVGQPRCWTRGSHARFPLAFRRAVWELVMATRVSALRGGGGGDGRGGGVIAAGPGNDGEIDEGGSTTPQLWGAGFADLVAMEPAILELVVGQMARLAFGCRVEGGKAGNGRGRDGGRWVMLADDPR